MTTPTPTHLSSRRPTRGLRRGPSDGSGGSSASTRTRSPSRVRRCSGRCCAGEKRTLKWFFFVQVIYTVGAAPGREPHAGHGRQRDRQPDRAALGLRPLHHVLGPVGARLLVHAAADSRTSSRTRSSSTCGCGCTRTSSRPSCAGSTPSPPVSSSPARSPTSNSSTHCSGSSPPSSGTRRSSSSVAIIVTIISPAMGIVCAARAPDQRLADQPLPNEAPRR